MQLELPLEGIAMSVGLEERREECRCEYPKIIHNNGSGHAPSCPVHRQWLRMQRSALKMIRKPDVTVTSR